MAFYCIFIRLVKLNKVKRTEIIIKYKNLVFIRMYIVVVFEIVKNRKKFKCFSIGDGLNK